MQVIGQISLKAGSQGMRAIAAEFLGVDITCSLTRRDYTQRACLGRLKTEALVCLATAGTREDDEGPLFAAVRLKGDGTAVFIAGLQCQLHDD